MSGINSSDAADPAVSLIADPAAPKLFSWKPPDLKEGGKWFPPDTVTASVPPPDISGVIPSVAAAPVVFPTAVSAPAAPPLFSWKPPDLKEGGKWFLTRIANLREACKSCPTHREHSMMAYRV